MSINVTVDNTTYEDINAMSLGGKTVSLEQITQDSDPFSESTGIMSFGHILHMCETALKSGTLRLSAPLNGATEIIDTELGDNMSCFFIFDDDATTFFDVQGEGLYFYYYDKTNNMIRAKRSGHTSISVGSDSGRLNFSFSAGKVTFTPRVANNDTYTAIISNRNYKWFAW